MYDAIVVGARCAGSPTAMLLARKGYKVLMVDRATFPSDSFRNHVILHQGTRLLTEWGLLDRIIATNAPPLTQVTQDMGDFPLKGTLSVTDGVTALYAPRRKYLDYILVQAAVEAGVELREGFSVQELVWDGERVIGIRGHAEGSETLFTEYAPIVIGADGLHSIVAREVEAPSYNENPVMSWTYYSYFNDVPISGVELYRQDDAMMLAFPTNDGLACVAAIGPIEGFPAFRADIEGNFTKLLARFPALADRVQPERRAERFLGTADLPNLFRKPHGPGWALVGDAGYHKDPVTGQGISDAFRDAALLSEAIDAGLSGRQDLPVALKEYESRRNIMAMPGYQGVLQALQFGPLPLEVLALRAALRNNPEDTSQYFGVVAGSVSPMAFYAPENVGRIMSMAQQPALAG
jgi:flavin-dependent dehydrogenase